MEIHLRPELADLIKQDIQRGPYQTVDEFVECAVAMLHEQEAWLAQNHAEIAAKVDQGYAAAERGELVDNEEARSRLAALKRNWSNQTQVERRAQARPQL
jgi:Arc/MetJ-type ribon-helix-helix transcriptional regulator